MREQATHLAELHWISYTMTARIRIGHTPMWDDLSDVQRDCLISAMELMLDLGHLAPRGHERTAAEYAAEADVPAPTEIIWKR